MWRTTGSKPSSSTSCRSRRLVRPVHHHRHTSGRRCQAVSNAASARRGLSGDSAKSEPSVIRGNQINRSSRPVTADGCGRSRARPSVNLNAGLSKPTHSTRMRISELLQRRTRGPARPPPPTGAAAVNRASAEARRQRAPAAVSATNSTADDLEMPIRTPGPAARAQSKRPARPATSVAAAAAAGPRSRPGAWLGRPGSRGRSSSALGRRDLVSQRHAFRIGAGRRARLDRSETDRTLPARSGCRLRRIPVRNRPVFGPHRLARRRCDLGWGGGS